MSLDAFFKSVGSQRFTACVRQSAAPHRSSAKVMLDLSRASSLPTPHPRGSDFHQITFGAPLKSFTAGGFQVVETRHGSMKRLGRHAHGDASINFVFAGGLIETLGNLGGGRQPRC